MTRIPLPPDHNHAIARYPRTALEAFPCDGREAVAMSGPHRQSGLALAAGLWLAITGAGAAAVWLQITF